MATRQAIDALGEFEEAVLLAIALWDPKRTASPFAAKSRAAPGGASASARSIRRSTAWNAKAASAPRRQRPSPSAGGARSGRFGSWRPASRRFGGPAESWIACGPGWIRSSCGRVHEPSPAFAEWITARLLQPEEREAVLGDLHEEYLALREQDGDRHARRWYWRQTWTSAIPDLRRRFQRLDSGNDVNVRGFMDTLLFESATALVR